MSRRRLVIAAVLLAALVAGFWATRRALGLDFDPESLRDAVAQMGVWAPLVFVGIVVFRVPLGLPSQLVLIGGGLVFGTLAGTLYGGIGLTISAVTLFIMSRWTGREALERRLPERMRRLMEIAGSRLGTVFVALGTGYPFGPITLYHALAGVTPMSLAGFVVAVAIGSSVRALTYTFFGSSLLSGDVARLLQATAVLGLVAVVPLLIPRSRAWILQSMGRG